MKISKITLALLLATVLIGTSARATDPPPATPSAADIQALMAILNKFAAQSAATESAPTTEPEPAPEPTPAPAAPAPAAKAPAIPVPQPLSTALKTGSLSTTGLAPSGGLGGRGPAAAVARLTEEGWRLLFPARQPGH